VPALQAQDGLLRMRRTLSELRYLWETRHGSGFPWPTWRGFGGGWRMALTGYPPWAAMPLWKQVLRIPLRPWRYWRRVREIARVRSINYHPILYDDVP
jgi:hypothetical protein